MEKLPLLKVEDLHLSFGEVRALCGVNFEIRPGEILGLIGPNGAGKTCLINSISGFYHPEQGKIYFKGQDILDVPSHKIAALGISRTFQNIELFVGLSALDNLLASRHLFFKSGVLADCVYWGRGRNEEIRQRQVVEDIIDFLEIEALRNRVVGALPYGLRKKVELGRALALEPELLLLDEPMTGMNVDEKEDIARYVLDIQAERGITILLVEHDMGVVMDIVDRIVVLDFGYKIAEGTPEEIRTNPQVIKAYLGVTA